MDVTPSEIERIEKKVARWERHEARQAELTAFVTAHGLKCFKCGSGLNEWAKVGTSEFGRRWAICLWCVRTKQVKSKDGLRSLAREASPQNTDVAARDGPTWVG